MMTAFLLSLYLGNCILLTVHELETASWHQANFLKLPNNLWGFLVFHSPLLVIMSYGLVNLYHQTSFGYTMSSLLAVGGMLAVILTFFKKNNLPIPKKMLGIIAILSAAQLILTMLI